MSFPVCLFAADRDIDATDIDALAKSPDVIAGIQKLRDGKDLKTLLAILKSGSFGISEKHEAFVAVTNIATKEEGAVLLGLLEGQNYTPAVGGRNTIETNIENREVLVAALSSIYNLKKCDPKSVSEVARFIAECRKKSK